MVGREGGGGQGRDRERESERESGKEEESWREGVSDKASETRGGGLVCWAEERVRDVVKRVGGKGGGKKLMWGCRRENMM